MTETNNTYAYLDNFIADLLTGNIEIVYSRAQKLVSYKKEKGWFGREITKNKAFPSELGHALTNYQESKNNPVLRETFANTCLRFIVWANTHQVIKRTRLLNRLNELEIENTRLKEEKDKYQKEIDRLTRLNEALHEAMNKFGGRIRSDGDKGQEGNDE